MSEAFAAQPGPTDEAAPQPRARGFTVRAAIIAIVFAVLAVFWNKESAFVTGAAHMGESVPPITALSAIIVLGLYNATLGRWKRLKLGAGEILCVFSVVYLVATVTSNSVVDTFFSSHNHMIYGATPENHLAEYTDHIPSWWWPTDYDVNMDLAEGSLDERVPWAFWVKPLSIWVLFFSSFYLTTYCLLALLYRRWSQVEKLGFPLAELMLSMVDGSYSRTGSWFKNSWFWIGFVIATIYNVTNFLKAAYFPEMPAMGPMYQIGQIFTNRPWDTLNLLWMRWGPDMFALGYFVSLEVLFTTWVTYLALRLVQVGGVAFGWDIPGLPFDSAQSTGAYIMLAILYLFYARKTLWQTFQRAFRGQPSEVPGILTPRFALFGLVVGLVFMLGFGWMSGMSWWIPLLLVGFLLMIGITYSRVRAETGTPVVWLFPFQLPQEIMIPVIGPGLFAARGARDLTLLLSMSTMMRGYWMGPVAAQVDSMRYSERLKLRPRDMFSSMVAMAPVAIALSFAVFLIAAYQYGNNVLFTTKTGFWVDPIHTIATGPPGAETPRRIAVGVGALIGLALTFLYRNLIGFPLHPLGFAMGSAFGMKLWWPFMMAWVIKSAVLKIGGATTYRRLQPLFFGLFIGHLVISGIAWAIVSSIFPDLVGKFVVNYD